LHGFEDEELIPNHEGLDKIKFKLRAFFLPIIYIFLLKKAHLIQPISIYMKDYLISKTSLNSNNFFPIPVSSTMLRLRGNKPKTLKNNSKIVYLGSLGAERDINFVINLFKLLTESSNNITFKIIGVVEKNTDINEIVKQLKEMNVYQDTEIFLNMPYRKIDMLLSDCHIGISPIKPLKKYIVATPSRVIDYMSNGLPIVCNKEISDHYHIVHSSKSGICTKYDTMQFKNSILSLLNNKENYSQMSHRSLSWISKNRTYDELSEELINRLVSYKVYQ